MAVSFNKEPSKSLSFSKIWLTQALTSPTVPTHSKGFTSVSPSSSSRIGFKATSFSKSFPNTDVRFFLLIKGDIASQVKRHFGHFPHHESVFEPTLQLLNAVLKSSSNFEKSIAI